MIDISFDEMLELARQAELEKQVEADGAKALNHPPTELPEVLSGKLGEAKEESGSGRPSGRASECRD